MAKGTKELKQRITGVQNIQQITSAMEMVATQKLKRLQTRADATRPFSSMIQEMVARLAGSVSRDLSPLLQDRDVSTTATLVVSSDKGMCGGYNANLVRFALETMGADESDQRLLVLGRKGDILLRAKSRTIDVLFEDVVEKLDFTRVRTIVRDLVKDGVMLLVKVPGTENVADALTKSLPFPALEKHREYLWGSGVPFSACLSRIAEWRAVAVFRLLLHVRSGA